MWIAVSTFVGLALLCSGAVSAVEEPADEASESKQHLTLPGFEVSIEVPADWLVEPEVGNPFPNPLHPTSPFTLRMWTGASGREDRAGCQLFAYSRLACLAPVDLETEIDGIGPPWERLPTAPAAFLGDEMMGDLTCVRHLTSDGADLFEVKCCGGPVPRDGWRSIADTLQLSDRTRPDRVAATRRNLVKDVGATNGIWSDAYGGTLVKEGRGSRGPAQKRIQEPRVVAAVDTLARPARTISLDEQVYRDEEGEEVLAIDTIRARKADLDTKADPQDVYDAMLAFATTEWEESRQGKPTLETVPVGHYQATRAVFDDGAAPEYVVASGNSAIKVRAATDEIAQTWLDGLPCHHLDVQRVITDYLIENRPDR